MRNRLEGQPKFNHAPIKIDAGATIVPCAREKEVFSVGLTPFQDHGRPAFYGSTIKSSHAITGEAKNLSHEDARRINEEIATQLERLLDQKPIDSAAVLSSSINGKPNIHVVTIGNPWNDSSLRLYCHPGEHNGATVLWVDGRTTRKGAGKVEGAFRFDGGYKAPKGWDSRKRS